MFCIYNRFVTLLYLNFKFSRMIRITGFSSWSAWNDCSKSCGGGTQEQTRVCERATCTADANGLDLTKVQACNVQECPTIGNWGAWSELAQCSATCGTGERQATRQCVGGSNCPGSNRKTKKCKLRNCPGKMKS